MRLAGLSLGTLLKVYFLDFRSKKGDLRVDMANNPQMDPEAMVKATWCISLALPLISCVTWRKSFTLSVPQTDKGNNSAYLTVMINELIY